MKYLAAFVGYGEAAYHISRGLAAEGLKSMAAFDVQQDSKERGELIQKRAAETGVTLVSSLQEAYESADFVFSLTSPAVCVQVAKSVIPYLKPGQVFVDFNSADPTDMAIIDKLPRAEGVGFCDAGVLGSVPESEHRTKMFLAGDGAKPFYEAMQPYNMVLTCLDAPAGGASAIKMFKSVFSKGLPQLLLECYVPAAAYGVLDQVLDLTRNTFKKRNVEEFADATLFRTLIHAKRRGVEAGMAAATVERLGFDASVTRATEKKLTQLAEYNYNERIGADESPDLRQVIAMILEDIQKKDSI